MTLTVTGSTLRPSSTKPLPIKMRGVVMVVAVSNFPPVLRKRFLDVSAKGDVCGGIADTHEKS